MAFSYKNFTASKDLNDAKKRKDQYNADYTESDKVSGLWNDYQTINKNKPAEWSGGTYGDQLNGVLNDILNRKKFSYDLNGDMLYQQYKDQYITQGKQAMIDAIGQASAMTGGYGNSYAQSVGQQTYQGYLQGLNDKIPELYQLALQAYQQDGEDLNNKFGVINNMYGIEYGQWRDSVTDWNADVDRAYNVYNNERTNEQTQYNTNRQYAADAYNNLYTQEYGKYSDDYSRAFSNYQQSVSEKQFLENLALQQAQLNEQIRANKASEALQRSRLTSTTTKTNNKTGKDDTENLKNPTSTMYDKAMKAYSEGGNAALDQYINTLPGYDTDMIFEHISNYGQLPVEQRTFTKTKDTFNWFGGVDGNDLVKDQYGNEYKIKDLPSSIQKDLSKLKEGQSWNRK